MSHATRIKEFVESSHCPIKGVPFRSLDEHGLEFVFDFMMKHKDLNDQTFKGKAHYLFIDCTDKPKNHIAIIEVLMTMCKST